MTIEDNIEVGGMPTICGSPLLGDHMPSEDTNLVRSLLNAGAIALGRINLPLWASDCRFYNNVHGITPILVSVSVSIETIYGNT